MYEDYRVHSGRQTHFFVRMKRTSKTCVINIVLYVVLAGSFLFSQQDTAFSADAYALQHPLRNVLYLSSYHEGIEWTTNLTEGIRKGLENIKDLDLYIEFMDSKRFPPKEYSGLFYEVIKKKYADISLSLIITSDDNALNFIKAHGEELFPDVPTVFCGANYVSLYDIAGFPNMVGIREWVDVAAGINLALKLHPDVDQIFFVFDKTPTGQKLQKALDAIKPQFKGITFRYAESLSLDAMLKTAGGLGKNALIMYLAFFRDAAGVYYDNNFVVQKLMESAKVPVYCATDLLLGKGPVGGVIMSSYYQGLAAGELASRILSGESVNSIPQISDSPNKLMFDYPALIKAGVRPAMLPEGSIILHRPVSFYSKYKVQIWVVLGALFALTLMVIFMGINILQRRRAQHALAAALDELRVIFDNTQAGMLLLGTDRTVLRCNQRLAELFGFQRPEEVIGLYSRDFHISQESYEKFDEEHLESLRSGEAVKTEYKLRRRDGREIWTMIAGRTLSRSQPPDLSRGVLFIVDDITDRKQAEMALEDLNFELENKVWERTEALASQALELQAANDRLKKLDSDKSAMISSVSHDLRTPLTSIRGFIKLIGKTFNTHFRPLAGDSGKLQDKAAKIEDNLAIIDKESERLTRLINDMLDLAKIESGQLVWRDQDLDIEMLFNQALDSVRGEFALHPEVGLLVDIEAGVPRIHADSDRVMQVLINLLNNAAKHVFKGSVTISAQALEDGFMCLSVRDTGVGIPKEHLPKVFQKFHQVGSGDTIPEQGKGTGLGLAICREIVEHYNGRIWVESEYGVGSTFFFTLPVSGRS